MEPSKNLNQIICSIGVHICKKNVSKLSCGHIACQTCVPSSWSSNNFKIKCKICNQINQNDLSSSSNESDIKQLLLYNCTEAFVFTKNEFNRSLSNLNGKYDILNLKKRKYMQLIYIKNAKIK